MKWKKLRAPRERKNVTKTKEKKKILKKFNRKEESNKTGNRLIKEEDKLERKKTMNDGMNKATKTGVVRYTLLFSLSSQNQTFVFLRSQTQMLWMSLVHGRTIKLTDAIAYRILSTSREVTNFICLYLCGCAHLFHLVDSKE